MRRQTSRTMRSRVILFAFASTGFVNGQTAGDCAWANAMQVTKSNSDTHYKIVALDPVAITYDTIHCFSTTPSNINSVGYNIVDNKGYAKFIEGGQDKLCRFGTGVPVAPDPTASGTSCPSPLSYTCLCNMVSGGNSATVINDAIFFSASGTSLRAITGLSSLTAGSSACTETTFSGMAYRSALWTGSVNDMSAITTTSGTDPGTYLVGLSKDGKVIITGPVLDSSQNLVAAPYYWVMGANLPAGFNADNQNFGAAFEYRTTGGSLYFAANGGEVFGMTLASVVSLIEGGLPTTCRNQAGTATNTHTSCAADTSIPVTLTITGPVLDTNAATTNNDGFNCPVYTDSVAGTLAPTNSPTFTPTATPTDAPTDAPTEAPTDSPTAAPTSNLPTAYCANLRNGARSYLSGSSGAPGEVCARLDWEAQRGQRVWCIPVQGPITDPNQGCPVDMVRSTEGLAMPAFPLCSCTEYRNDALDNAGNLGAFGGGYACRKRGGEGVSGGGGVPDLQPARDIVDISSLPLHGTSGSTGMFICYPPLADYDVYKGDNDKYYGCPADMEACLLSIR